MMLRDLSVRKLLKSLRSMYTVFKMLVMKKCGSTKILLSNDLAAPTQILKTVTLRVL